MSHSDAVLAILQREQRRHADEARRTGRLARLRRPTRDRLVAADATIERTRKIMLRLRHWNVYFGRTPRG